HLADGLRDLDLARTCFGTVENRTATPDTLAVVQDIEPLGSRLVATVENKAVSIDDRRRSHELLVRPEGWTGRGARSTQDALRRVVVDLTLLDRLQPLPFRWPLLVDHVGHHGAVLVEEG